jgi:hypothetical protein
MIGYHTPCMLLFFMDLYPSYTQSANRQIANIEYAGHSGQEGDLGLMGPVCDHGRLWPQRDLCHQREVAGREPQPAFVVVHIREHAVPASLKRVRKSYTYFYKTITCNYDIVL